MAAITRLCPRAILLDSGKVLDDGRAHDVVGRYLSTGLDCLASRTWPDPDTAPGGEVARLRAVSVETVDGEISETFDMSEPVNMSITYEVLKGGHLLLPHFNLFTSEGVHAFTTIDVDPNMAAPRAAARALCQPRPDPGEPADGRTIFVEACCHHDRSAFDPDSTSRTSSHFM